MNKETRKPQHITIEKTELDVINDFIKEATTFYQDSKTPAEFQSEELALKLYDTLYEYRDTQPERPLDRPVKYTLIEIFKELKYGRPGESQKQLNDFINQLENK